MPPGYLLFGIRADRFGRKRTLILYLALAAILVPAFALARRPSFILLTGSVAAFFGSGFFTGSGILGSELFPTGIRATALGHLVQCCARHQLARTHRDRAPGEAHGLSSAFSACAVGFACAALSALWVPETRGLDLT